LGLKTYPILLFPLALVSTPFLLLLLLLLLLLYLGLFCMAHDNHLLTYPRILFSRYNFFLVYIF
jgi:hypothetical protein